MDLIRGAEANVQAFCDKRLGLEFPGRSFGVDPVSWGKLTAHPCREAQKKSGENKHRL